MAESPRRARGEGTVYYDPELRRFVAMASAGRDDATGRRRRIKRTGATRTDAARRLKVALAAEGTSRKASGPRTVAELLERWLEAGAPSRKRKGEVWLATTANLTRVHLIPTLGHRKIDQLRPEHVEAMLDGRTHLARSTLVRLRVTLAQAYDWAIARRSAQWNPARVAMTPDVEQAPSPRRALTVDEVELLLAGASSHRLGAWVVLALASGLRPGECSALRWEDVDLDQGVVVVRATKTKTVRTLALPAPVIDGLRAHRRRQMEERLMAGDRWPVEWERLVFRTQEGTPLEARNTRRFIGLLAKRSGISGNVTPYDLRHTVTTRLSAKGVAPELLADLLGHKDTRMVFKHYRHPVTPVIGVAADHYAGA